MQISLEVAREASQAQSKDQTVPKQPNFASNNNKSWSNPMSEATLKLQRTNLWASSTLNNSRMPKETDKKQETTPNNNS